MVQGLSLIGTAGRRTYSLFADESISSSLHEHWSESTGECGYPGKNRTAQGI
jgi:hypothetical protein